MRHCQCASPPSATYIPHLSSSLLNNGRVLPSSQSNSHSYFTAVSCALKTRGLCSYASCNITSHCSVQPCTRWCLQPLVSSAWDTDSDLSLSPWQAARSTDSSAFVDTCRIPAMSPDSSSSAASAGRFLKNRPRLGRRLGSTVLAWGNARLVETPQTDFRPKG